MRDLAYSRERVRHIPFLQPWCARLAFLGLLLSVLSTAQELPQRASAADVILDASNSTPTFSKQVDEVQLVFTVTDKSGRFVDQLELDDFRLLDNNLPPERVYNFQQRTDLPLQVVLLVDISSSIQHRFAFEQNAAVTFLRKVLRPGIDSAAVIAFGSSVQRMQPMTKNALDWETAIYCLSPSGETALYDAIVMGSKSFSSQRTFEGARKVMIVLTDGADTISAASEGRALRSAGDSEATVLVIDAATPGILQKDSQNFLKKLATISGGTVLRAADNNDMKRALQNVEKVLRTQYSLSYKPAGFQSDGTYRSIHMSAQKSKLTVRCRAGYYARAQTHR